MLQTLVRVEVILEGKYAHDVALWTFEDRLEVVVHALLVQVVRGVLCLPPATPCC